MASGRFFDPLVALRTAPLISATCSLVFAKDEEFFLSIFSRPENRELSKPLLPSYFSTFFNNGLIFVLSALVVTTGTSIANLYTRPWALQAHGSYPWYVAGAVLSASHLLFVPSIAPSCKTLAEAKPDDDNHATLDEWRNINWIRGITADLGAWATLVVAVFKTLEAN